jgi:hypothetical protein
MLIESGADVHVQNKDSQSPLELLQSQEFALEMKGRKKARTLLKLAGLTSQLANDMRNAINCKEYSDFQFQVEDKVIFAHKIVLYARCKYFRQLLEKNPDLNSYKVEDISWEIFSLVVEFIYTDYIKIQPTDILDLSKAAVFFQLERLESSCGSKKNVGITA